MAVTKIKAIKSTLDKAIKYICNPQKTQGGVLIDSSGCVPEFAARQMEATAEKNKRGGCRKAYHLMQSFAPDDNLTPGQALEIGRQFADQVTKGMHQFVIAVHTDCDHIHCHIIFNAVDTTPDHLKYRYQGYSERDRIRDISDQLCRDNGLSVLPRWTKGERRRRSKYSSQYVQNKKSWRDKLGDAIDRAVLTSETYEDFITAMEVEEGYTFKDGKRIAFLAEGEGQKKYTRCDTIGEDYTEERIRDRIANREKYQNVEMFARGKNGRRKERSIKEPDDRETTAAAECVLQNVSEEKASDSADRELPGGDPGLEPGKSTSGMEKESASGCSTRPRMEKYRETSAGQNKRKIRAARKINLISDLSQNVKAQNSPGYKHAAEKNNLNMLVKTMNYLAENDIETPERFQKFYESCYDEVNGLNKRIQETDLAIAGLNEKRHHIRKYFKYLKFYNTFMKYRNMNYYREHEKELQEFELSRVWLERSGINPREYKAQEYQEEYARLKCEKEALTQQLQPAKSRLYDTRNVLRNVESVLGIKIYESREDKKPAEQTDKENVQLQDNQRRDDNLTY